MREPLEELRCAQHTRDSMLVDASTILLAATLDLACALNALVARIVPDAADWCIIDLVEGEPRTTLLHRDPAKMGALRALRERHPIVADVPCGGVNEVILTGEPHLVTSDTRAAFAAKLDADVVARLDELGWSSSIVFPMRARGRTVGEICLVSASPERPLGPADLPTVEHLAAKIALAVDNAHLFQSEQRARAEMQTLYTLLDAISRAASLDEVCEASLDAVQRAARIDRTSILLLHDDAHVMRFRAWRRLSDEYRAAVEGHSPWPRGTRDAAPIVIGDVTVPEALAALRPVFAKERIASVVFVPLVFQGELLGKFMLYSDVARPFSDETVRLVQAIASQVAHAVAKKRADTEAEEARRAAEEANRMKDQFLAVVSHELRTPLSAIAGWTAILRSGKKSDPATLDKALGVIERNVHVQTKIVEDILDVSRIITGKLVIEPVPVDLGMVVVETLDSVRAAASAKQIDLRFVHADDPVIVVGDADRLRQIVWNLLSNAIKFTPDRGRVEVRLERSGSGVLVRVSDTGKGIAPEFLPHVFERFRQADSSTTRRHTGLGLGLAIVRHLVELHGGRVRAESAGEDRGATFEVFLPVHALHTRAVQPDPRAPADARAARERRAARLDGVRVLAVDDDADARELLSETLRGFGADVRTVPNARAALDELDAFAPAVVVADVGMPEEDGYSLVRRLRAAPSRRARLGAVALTAFAHPDEARRALDVGFDRHLAKPADPDELACTIAELAGAAR